MERVLPVSREDWEQHVAEDEARGRDVNDLTLAMFGDPNNPETVKQAVMPTMTRLNTYMDGLVMLIKFGVGAVMAVGAVVAIAKNVGWL